MLFSSVKFDIEDQRSSETSKTQIYRKNQKRLNMHIAMHHETAMTEFDMFSNINVLIDKNKHKCVFL